MLCADFSYERSSSLHKSGLFPVSSAEKSFRRGWRARDFLASGQSRRSLGQSGCPSNGRNGGQKRWPATMDPRITTDPETQHESVGTPTQTRLIRLIHRARRRKRAGRQGRERRLRQSTGAGRSPFRVWTLGTGILAGPFHLRGDGKGRGFEWRLCLVPTSDYEIIETWYANGNGGRTGKQGPFVRFFVGGLFSVRVGAPGAPGHSALPAAGPSIPGRGPQHRPALYRSRWWLPPPATRLARPRAGAAEGAYENFSSKGTKWRSGAGNLYPARGSPTFQGRARSRWRPGRAA